MSEPPSQFVLLHHVLPDGEHWDLCLDQGQTLATWQLLTYPSLQISQADPIPARRLADHRRAYLDYEGPVSGGRGHVTRVDRGTYVLLDRQPDRWVVRLSGSVMIGTYEIAAIADSGLWNVYRT